MILENIALYDSNITIIMVVVFVIVCVALVGFLFSAMTSSNKEDTETKD